jgi:hypothetical protein
MKKHFLFLLGLVGFIAMSCNPDESNELPTPPNDNDTTQVVTNDTVSFDVIPLTSLSERAVSKFKNLTKEELLAATAGSAYICRIENICFRENGKVFYVPVNFWEKPIYNVYEGLDGGGVSFITFYEGYTTKLLYTCCSGVIFFYDSYIFDESTQQLASKAVDGHWVKENVYTLVYADADYIVLESEIHDAAIERWKLPSGRDYFVREVLVHHTGELEEPTEVRDNRK